MGVVASVSEQTGMVTIQLEPDPVNFYAPRFSDVIHVPLARLIPPRNQVSHERIENKSSFLHMFILNNFTEHFIKILKNCLIYLHYHRILVKTTFQLFLIKDCIFWKNIFL